MKANYIFGGGDSDGLLGVATILNAVGDAFFSFTSPRTLPDIVSQFVKGPEGEIYLVDLAVDSSTHSQLFLEMEKRPGFSTHFFDQHNLPQGLTPEKLPFSKVSIDGTISSCESAYVEIENGLDVMIPAIASLNDGIQETKMIQLARERHGERLDKNAEILKFGLAYNIKDNKFKRTLTYAIKEGAFPEAIDELVLRYNQGISRFDEIKSMADKRKEVLSHLTYGYFPNFRGGYTNMIAGYLAESTKTPVGVCVLETDRKVQKLNVICNDSEINIGQVVHKVAGQFQGFGGGSQSSGGATIRKQYTPQFLQQLNQGLSEYKR